MPDAKTELNYTTDFELLVAVALSAQCTDKRVNMVTPTLFKRFPDAFAMAESSQDEIFHYIKSISYPNNKAKHLFLMANLLVNEFDGKIPNNIVDLQRLPGVGRKTANVVVSVLFESNHVAIGYPDDFKLFGVKGYHTLSHFFLL